MYGTHAVPEYINIVIYFVKNYLKENIPNYEKKSWIKPILLGILGYIILFTVLVR